MSADRSSDTRRPSSPESVELDRRRFLGTVGLTAGAVIAASVAPLAARGADGPRVVEGSAEQADFAESGADASTEALWDVDDMWGNRPRYAHPIPYAHGIPGAGPLESSGPYSVLRREP